MVVLTVSELVSYWNSDCTTFREGVSVLGTLNHRISVYIASEGEILRIRESAKFSSLKRLWVSKWAFFVFNEITAPVLAPPHILSKLVVRHIPTGILEESKSNSGDFRVCLY